MRKLLYIERLVIAVWLLLLLAVAPAMAQNDVYEGEITPLTVEQKGLDKYQWHLYKDSTVNFAVEAPDVNPPYAEFIGDSNKPDVSVRWKIPGTYFFKVTAVDANDCTMNLKIGRMVVKRNPIPVITAAVATHSRCPGEKGKIFFSVTNVPPGSYTVKHDRGEFDVTVVADTFSIEVPAGKYNNLTIQVNGYSSFDALNPVNAEVKQPSPFVFYPTITPINLMTNVNGAILLRVQGGNGGYTYNWSNGATTHTISNLEAGDYSVIVTDKAGCSKTETFKISVPSNPPVAVNDTINWRCNTAPENLIKNDLGEIMGDLYIDTDPLETTKNGSLQLYADGTFVYRPNPTFTGIDQFKYRLYDKSRYAGIYATVILIVVADFDYDGIPDHLDPDADGDGILNIYEALPGQDWRTADFDNDGLPNYLDIDSDGDGIVDNFEAQGNGTAYKAPKGFDSDGNGIDDAYDGLQSGYVIKPGDIDSDGDGVPDYLDLDSDNDSVKDYIEGHDADRNGRPDQKPRSKYLEDADGDGLDDEYDNVFNVCGAELNALGSKAAMQDTDKDGLRDWRDDNDDGDDYLTRLEDLDGDGDYSNDDFDYDGIPEYLDYGRACDLFIPNAFSPGTDGVHDTFMIYCLNHFPNAKIYIFDQSGNKLFEQANYGREDIYGKDKAWWDGRPDRGRNKGELVPPGTYFYVLDLGNGEVKKSFVFLSY